MQNNNTVPTAVAESWEAYKAYNDKLEGEIIHKGSPDPLTIEAVHNLQHNLDDLTLKNMRPIGVEEESQHNYHKMFSEYVRFGNEQPLLTKSLSAGSNKDGGYLVTPRVSELVTQSLQMGVMRSLADTVTISTDAYEYIEDAGNLQAVWVEEESARPDTKEVELSKKVIFAHEVYAQPKATQRLLDDSMIDIESWLADKISNAFGMAEEQAFFHGDGQGKPFGILHYEHSQINQVKSNAGKGTFNSDNILDLIYALPERYANNATMVMHRSAIHQLRALKMPSTGQYLWQPATTNEQHSMVFGVKICESPYMPAPATGAKAIAIADFRAAYKIVDRSEIQILRDPYTAKPFVKFYSTKRVGGDVVNNQAIKMLVLS